MDSFSMPLGADVLDSLAGTSIFLTLGLKIGLEHWVGAFLVPSVEANVIASLLVDEIISRHWAPRVLLCDRGITFLS